MLAQCMFLVDLVPGWIYFCAHVQTLYHPTLVDQDGQRPPDPEEAREMSVPGKKFVDFASLEVRWLLKGLILL